MKYRNTLLVLGFLGALSSCKPDEESFWEYLDPSEQLSGGGASINDASPLAFSKPIIGLEGDNELLFFVGNSFFNQNWVIAPASTTARDGLGPFFNSRSCSGCHFKDGRGRPPEYPGEVSTGLLIRLSTSGMGPHGEPLGHAAYGGQLQDQAISGVPSEGDYTISYNTISGQYDDGSSYSLREPNYQLNFTSYGGASGVMFSPRVANQMIGLGLLEALSESTILERADQGDANGDGISGRPNYVWNSLTQTTELGRFGWKANQPNLLMQTADAFLGDLGITSFINPADNCTSPQNDCQNAANGGQPEIDDDDLRKVELYCRTLAVPVRRNYDAPDVLKGKELFFSIGCESCHRSKMVTGNHSISALSGETIFPYTDMLLHDMGEGLADNRPDFLANGNEWRTPPLWGIGLFQTVNGHTNYMHDGRARNLEEAILWHGGEAENSNTAFRNLTSAQRNDIITFLNSL